MTAQKLSSSLLASVRESGCWNGAGNHVLPTRDATLRILDLLLYAMFPGYWADGPIGEIELEDYLEERLHTARRILVQQVSAASGVLGGDGSLQAASQVADNFLGSLGTVRAILEEDVKAAFRGDPAARSVGEILLAYPCVDVIATYRLANALLQLGVPLLPRIWTERAHSRTGADIHPGATIGKGFFIDHCTGVVIGETCVIGDRVKLYQGVTLGALSHKRDEEGNLIKGLKRHPTVGDDVTIYAGATVLGGQTVIGSRSIIGGNVWLTHSVPEGSRVMQAESDPHIKCPATDATRT